MPKCSERKNVGVELWLLKVERQCIGMDMELQEYQGVKLADLKNILDLLGLQAMIL